jgi:hypothetical protein
MVVIEKGITDNNLVFTLSEKLNEYGIIVNTGQTFTFVIQNDYNINKTETFDLVDISDAPLRFNKFQFDETLYDLDKGTWSYSASTSATTQTLEIGRILVK